MKKNHTKKIKSMGAKGGVSPNGFFSVLKEVLHYQKIALMEAGYGFHLIIRYFHDAIYHKNKYYRAWSDKPYSDAVHKITLVTFVATFAVLSLSQMLLPGLQQYVYAGSTTKTWTTKGDFSAASNSGLSISGSNDADDSSVTLSSSAGSGANMLLLWDGATAPAGWEIISDGVGEPFYQKFIRGADTYGGTGGSDALHNHTFTPSNPGSSPVTNGSNSGTSVAASYHAHTITNSSLGASSNNGLPPYRSLKVIKYLSGISATIPAGAIAFFDTTVPANWSQYSVQNNYFVQGGSSVTTGGNATHDHTANITLSSPTATASVLGEIATNSASTTHTHSSPFSSSVVSASNEPLYVSTIMAKANIDTSLPLGIISMFDNNPDGWTKISGSGGVFENRYIKGSSTFAGNLGGSTHVHNGSITTGYAGGATSYAASGGTASSAYHTHSIDYVTSNSNNLPPYINVIMAKKEFPFGTSGTLGGSSTGLRIGDPSDSTKSKWSSFSWNGTNITSTYKVKVQVRAADTWGTGDTGYVNPSTNTATWYDATSNTGTIPINSAIVASKTLEVRLNLVGDGLNTPTLTDLSVSYDTLESPINTNLSLRRTDNAYFRTSANIVAVEGVPDAWSNSTTIRVSAAGLTCTSCATAPTNIRPEVEIKPVGTAFTGTTNIYAATAGNTYVDISGLTPGMGYHLQVRAIDDQGRVSTWTSYGNNLEANPDITIDQTTPTGTVSINAGAQYATSNNVTLTNTTSDTGGSGLSQMQFSNDGTTWSGWETYNATKAWSLATGDGTKTVYAQYRDNAGNVGGKVFTSQADWQVGTLSNLTVTAGGDISRVPQISGYLDGEISAVSGSYIELHARKVGNTYYRAVAEWDENNWQYDIYIYKVVNGVSSQLTGYVLIWDDGDPEGMKFKLTGTNLKIYWGAGASWTEKISITDSSILNAGTWEVISGTSAVFTPTSGLVNTPSYGTLGETGTPLSVDSGVGVTQKWLGLSWNASALTHASNAIKYQVSVDGTNWIGPSGATGNWTTNYFGQIYGGSQITAIPSSLTSSRYLYVKLQIESTESDAPVLYDLAVQSAVSDTISIDSLVPTGSLTVGASNPAYTATKAVTVYLDPTTPEPGGSGIKEFQLSNDGINWGTAYNPITATYTAGWQAWNETYRTAGAGFFWNLIKGQSDSGTDGNRTVYINFRDNAENISNILDTSNYIQIGNQIWANKNIDVGTNISVPINQTNNALVEKYCYNNNPNNCVTYGGLYQWNEAMQYSVIESTQGICPTGLHVPSDSEWKTLEITLGMSQSQADATGGRGTDQGTQIKAGGSSGFNALFSGYTAAGNFGQIGTYGYFTTSSLSATNIYYRAIDSSTKIYRDLVPRTWGAMPVRCIADTGTTNVTISNISDTISLDTFVPTVPTNTITSPNGTDKWAGGSTKEITWNKDLIVDNTGGYGLATNPIKLEYTTNGTDYIQIATGEANDGSYTWDVVVSLNSTTVKIRITATDTAGYSATDISDANFTVDSTSPTGTVSINAGAAYATSTTATLTVSATDTGGSGLSQMRFSNDGTTWSSWETYNTTKSWTLATGDGAKTVYAQFKDNAGNVSGYLSNPGGGAWSRKATVQITNFISNFQTKVIINYQAGMKSDFADIRFVDLISGVELPYWVTSVVGGTSAEFWVKTSTNSNIGIFYGNSLATSSSNGSLVFEDFDDFENQSLGSTITGWTKSGGTWNVVSREEGKVISNTQTGTLLYNDTNTGDRVIEVDMLDENFDDNQYYGLITGKSGNNYSAVDWASRSKYVWSHTYDGSTSSGSGIQSTNSGLANVYQTLTLKVSSAGNLYNIKFLNVDRSFNYAFPVVGQSGLYSSYNPGNPIYFDNYRIRKYNAVDPVSLVTEYGDNLEGFDTITLDTEPPTFFSLSFPATNTWSPTEPSPSFTWGASSGHDKYQLWIDGVLNKDNIASGTTSVIPTSPLAEGNHTWTIKAVDGAGNITIANETWNYGYDPSIPGRVTGLTATTNDIAKVSLSWNAYADLGAPLDNYKLERVKYLEYLAHSMSANGDWSSGDGYATYTLANNITAFDDDPTDPQQGQVALETSVKYTYRIKVKDTSNPEYSLPQLSSVYGMTQDGKAPDDVTGVSAIACDGTAPNCFDIANEGFEIKITWNPSVDTGSGIAKYNVYRATTNISEPASYEMIGETANPGLVLYDNDALHADPANRLNDFSTYYYRVTATDASTNANESNLFPMLDPTTNADSAQTPDVTAPTVPSAVTATPMGLDPSGSRQRVNITWTASNDIKARSSEAGIGVKEYRIYRATTENGSYTQVGTVFAGVELSYNNDNLDEFTDFYYKVMATDNSDNETALSDPDYVKTASNSVPTVPTSVIVTSKKGNPVSDPEVGDKITVSYRGSYSKNCLNNIRCIVKYELYRSTTNWANAADWTNPAKATLVHEENVVNLFDDRDTTYTFDDSGLTDATTYYYKVRTLDNSPEVPDGGPFYSGLSVVSTGTLYAGWDTTPDTTPPTIPAGGLEVKVRDTHPNEFELRNIVTWKMLTAEQLPTRNGVTDFARYEIHREVVNPATNAVLSDTNVGNITDLGDNYYVDIIPIAFADLKYKYYIVVCDNADTDYKYSDDTVINAYYNTSAKEYWTDSIIPSQAKPVLTTPVTLSNISVASAEVSWTTDQEADSLVQFRVKGSSGDWVAIGQIERSINHNVNLFGLTPNTEYEYQIVSRNYLGNNVEYESNTLPTLRTTGFTITPGSLTTTTSTTEINWTTNLNASSAFVEYQLQRQPGDEPQGGTAGVDPEALSASPRNHRVIIKGLRSARTYTYKIKSISSDGYLSESPEGEFANFKTRAFDSAQFTLAPASSNVAERNITATTAQIVWQTETPTTSWVDYSTTSGTYDNAAGNNDLVGTHVVVIEGLVPGTKYFYRVRVKDANEIEYTSQEYSFTAVLKPKISNMTVKNITPYSVTIAWDTNVDTETIINWGTTTAYGEKRGKSGVSKVHEITVDNLLDNEEYHYQILASDEAGNEVADTDKIVRTPLDTEGPKITNVKIDVLPMGENDNTSSIIVSWQTNKPASTLVEYGEGVIGGTYDKRSVEDTSLNNSHTVIIKDLTPASSYHYRLVSADKRSNKTVSQDYTFVTPSKEKSILQLIIKSLEETFSWTRNINQFFGNIGNRLMGR